MTRVAGVLQLTSKTRYGLTSRNVPMYLFSPLNTVFPQMIVASTHKDLKKNILAVAEKMNDDPLPRGQLVDVIGTCGDPLAERKAIHVAYSPDYWTKIPVTEYPSFNRPVLDVPTINIDPEGCVDIDDCISIWKTDEGITKVAITIADVAEWVRVNTWMSHAQNIGQSLYDGGVPVRSMFPKTLEEKMSLMPGEKRLGYTLFFDWSGDAIWNPHFKEVVIVNKKSYTYDNCRLATEIPMDTLRSICEHMAGRKPLLDPHDWVAELMIFYNKQMANSLTVIGKGLLRHHSAPSAEKLEKYERLGLNARMFAYASATYEHVCPEIMHWGFQTRYCHGSSPIRRWADVVNQMAMKGMEVPNAKDDCNRLQKFAKKHARDLAFLDILQRRPEDVKGIVISPTRIWIPDWNRLITSPNTFPEGTQVNVTYFLDMQRPTWKQRLVFHVKTDSESGRV
jgi:hypothetical protein